MFVFTLLLLTPLAQSLVRLQNSVLFDEVDFKGIPQVTTTMCAAGCKVYSTISITTENTRITQNILINEPLLNQNTSVGDLSSLFLQDFHEKAYIEMGNAPTVTIYNTNVNLESAPLALWIVSTKSPYYEKAEVFEPLLLNRAKATAPYPITILSAQPFTLTVQPGDNNAVFARTTGYDAIDRNNVDNCYTAMDYDYGGDFFGLSLSINGPLLTLAFDSKKYPKSEVMIKANTAFNFQLFPYPNEPVFLSSPGFVCGSPTSDQVYRSSALQKSKEYTLNTPDNTEMVFNFEMDVVSEEEHPVTIYNPNTKKSRDFYGNFKDKTNSAQMTLQTNRATVNFTPGTVDSFFGMRVTADVIGTTKTTTSGRLDSTTSSSCIHTFIVLPLAILVLLNV